LPLLGDTGPTGSAKHVLQPLIGTGLMPDHIVGRSPEEVLAVEVGWARSEAEEAV